MYGYLKEDVVLKNNFRNIITDIAEVVFLMGVLSGFSIKHPHELSM